MQNPSQSFHLKGKYQNLIHKFNAQMLAITFVSVSGD